MKCCCKKVDYDDGEEIDAISSTEVLKSIRIDEKKEGKREIKGLNRKQKKLSVNYNGVPGRYYSVNDEN